MKKTLKNNKTLLKNIGVSSGIMVGILSSGFVKADLSDVLGDVATSYTSGMAWRGQGRIGYQGGSGRVYFKTKNIQLYSITPPHLSIGCGGISWSLGGFDFIDGEELIEFLQASGQAAASQVILLTASTLCPPCANALKTIQTWSQYAANTALDSCAAGKAVANAGAGMLYDGLRKECSDKSRESNQDSSFIKAISNGVCGKDKGSYSIVKQLGDTLKSEGYNVEEEAMADKIKGNPLWWGFRQSGIIPKSLTNNESYSSVFSALSLSTSEGADMRVALAEAATSLYLISGGYRGYAQGGALQIVKDRAEIIAGMIMCGANFSPNLTWGSNKEVDNSIVNYCQGIRNKAEGVQFPTCRSDSENFAAKTCTRDGSDTFNEKTGWITVTFNSNSGGWSSPWMPSLVFNDGVIEKVHKSFDKAYQNIENNESPAKDNNFLLFMLQVMPFDLYRVMNIASVNVEAAKEITTPMELYISREILTGFFESYLKKLELVKYKGNKMKIINVSKAMRSALSSIKKSFIQVPKKYQDGFKNTLELQELIMGRIQSVEQDIIKSVSVKYLDAGKRFTFGNVDSSNDPSSTSSTGGGN